MHTPKRICCILTALILATMLLPPAPASADGGWHTECVDCPKYVAEMSDRSLRLDGDGHPHIAYGGDHLYYAWHDGTGWHYETVDKAPGVGEHASLALDGSGRPHISYLDRDNWDLKYAWHDGTTWQIETVDSGGNVGEYSSLALDGLGRPHISYRDYTNGDLKYAWHDETTWQIEMVDSEGYVGIYTSLALDGAGRPHVSYYGGYDGGYDLKYAWHDGVDWQIETVDSSNECSYTSLALDGSGRPHISYQGGAYPDNDLKYARHDGTAWQIETVDSGGNVGEYSSLALDGLGRPHISYRDYTNGDLKYAWYDGAGWQIETVDSADGGHTSLALDRLGQPHISYGYYGPKYAWHDGVDWQIETVDSSNECSYTSLALDGSGRPHISYYDGSNGDLKYAWYDGAGWQIETVDSVRVNHTSLVLDGAGRPHISYYDGSNRDLKYTWREPDTTPPAAITDLAASTGGSPGQVNLTWTAPGDDGDTGTAMTYTSRYRDTAIVSEFGWLLATDVSGEPTPLVAGTPQTMTVSGLTPGQTYYFAIKTQDEVPNTSGLSNSPSATAKEGPAWTLMFYMDGDNNLDDNYVAAFNQLESAAGNPNANILVAWDRSDNGNSAYYKVKYDVNLNQLASYTQGIDYWAKGELNMGDPNTLAVFVQWARAAYPASHYALVISDHGTGLGGLATDSGSGGDWLKVTEWSSALATATSDGTDKIDVVFVDACLMAMIEDAYQIRNYTDYYVASQNIGWVTGGATSGPYDDYISGIGATTSPQDLATIFVNRYAEWLNADYNDNDIDRHDLPYTISAVDLGQLAPLVSAVNTLASNLNTQMGIYGSQVTNARTATQKFDSNVNYAIDQNDAYVDLHDFAQNVRSNVPDATIQNAAQGVMDAISNYVIAEAHHTGSYNGTTWNLDGSHGVSIFFPPNASSFYNSTNYEFAVGAIWPGSQSALIGIQASDVEWGPMLVTYFNVTQPGGPDTPTPPDPASPLVPPAETNPVYLPVIMKDY